MLNRLKDQRVYLAGAIDRVKDKGVGWRNSISPFLSGLGLVVNDPLKKTSDVGIENSYTHEKKKIFKATKDYESLSSLMKEIRRADLRLVDTSDFLLVNIDLDIHPCGTYEEIFLANRQKKPIIIHIEQGKNSAPDWLFGTIPHQMIFSKWKEIEEYLNYIDHNVSIETYNRWFFK